MERQKHWRAPAEGSWRAPCLPNRYLDAADIERMGLSRERWKAATRYRIIDHRSYEDIGFVALFAYTKVAPTRGNVAKGGRSSECVSVEDAS